MMNKVIEVRENRIQFLYTGVNSWLRSTQVIEFRHVTVYTPKLVLLQKSA